MRKLLIFIGLFLTLGLSGQLPGVVASQTTIIAGGYCTEYQAVYNAMTNKPTAGIATAQNTMVQSLVTAGVWAKLDLFYCFAQYSNTANEALLNWINPATFTCTNVSSTAWATLEGFTGDGTADYLNTGWRASVDGVNYTKDAATIGCYLRVNEEDLHIAIGLLAYGTPNMYLRPNYNDAYRSVLNGTTEASVSVTTSLGLFTVTRSSSTILTFYQGASDLGDVSDNSTAIPDGRYVVFLAHDGNANNYSTNQISFGYLGGLLTDADVIILNTAIETYMDSNAKGVQ